ncbi:hypothetical protein DFJ77DRAFT_439069 [Powellomyces hirtus]|nr:hypothetical protein DFJ77DRAFT_439069 [Powellomyces hirtus]
MNAGGSGLLDVSWEWRQQSSHHSISFNQINLQLWLEMAGIDRSTNMVLIWTCGCVGYFGWVARPVGACHPHGAADSDLGRGRNSTAGKTPKRHSRNSAPARTINISTDSTHNDTIRHKHNISPPSPIADYQAEAPSQVVPISTKVLALLKAQLAELTSRARIQAHHIASLEADVAGCKEREETHRTGLDAYRDKTQRIIAGLEAQCRTLKRQLVLGSAAGATVMPLSTNVSTNLEAKVRALELDLFREQIARKKAEEHAQKVERTARAEHDHQMLLLYRHFEEISHAWTVRELQQTEHGQITKLAQHVDGNAAAVQGHVKSLLIQLRQSLDKAPTPTKHPCHHKSGFVY